MLYRVADGNRVSEVAQTTTVEEELYEERVEDWLAQTPDMLGEPLVIVGRQVELDAGRDRIDLLALAKDGTLVVIEVKRDLIGGSADLQALRYTAVVSSWSDCPELRDAEQRLRALLV